jgi:Zn-finger nucleic acid-binding protein
MFVPPSAFHQLLASGDPPESRASSQDQDERSGRCPADGTIMSRATVHSGSDTPTIHLERCSSCHGVWFDAGEWSILSGKHLLEHIDEFWSAEWRRTQRRTIEREEDQRRLEQAFGAELLGQIRTLAAALQSHPRRSQALALLREESSITAKLDEVYANESSSVDPVIQSIQARSVAKGEA